jgi:hypothetical protein
VIVYSVGPIHSSHTKPSSPRSRLVSRVGTRSTPSSSPRAHSSSQSMATTSTTQCSASRSAQRSAHQHLPLVSQLKLYSVPFLERTRVRVPPTTHPRALVRPHAAVLGATADELPQDTRTPSPHPDSLPPRYRLHHVLSRRETRQPDRRSGNRERVILTLACTDSREYRAGAFVRVSRGEVQQGQVSSVALHVRLRADNRG